MERQLRSVQINVVGGTATKNDLLVTRIRMLHSMQSSWIPIHTFHCLITTRMGYATEASRGLQEAFT